MTPAADSVHAMAFYPSDAALIGLVSGVITDGQRCGEPTVVAFGADSTAVLTAAGALEGATVLPQNLQESGPAVAIKAYQEACRSLIDGGAGRIRVVAEVPHPGTGASWDVWSRYEAALSLAFADVPISWLCPYDTRITPEAVLEDVRHTHGHLVNGGGRPQPNRASQDPLRFLRARPIAADPVETTTPDLELSNPQPFEARYALAQLLAATASDDATTHSLLLAVSETVTNAVLHGSAPACLRVWIDGDRIVIAVTDAGPGPSDPLAGLVPAITDGAGGFGLWLTHQVVPDVVMRHDERGFTVRMTAVRRTSE